MLLCTLVDLRLLDEDQTTHFLIFIQLDRVKFIKLEYTRLDLH
jgi:hypothetical protein